MGFNAAQWAWCVFDIGAYGFGGSTYGMYVPVWFNGAAVADGLSPARATEEWGYMVSLGLLASSIVAPCVGYIADRLRIRKLCLAVTLIVSTACLCLAVQMGSWYKKMLFCILGSAFYAVSQPLYNAFLPLLTRASAADGGGSDAELAVDLSVTSTWFGNGGAAVMITIIFLFEDTGKHFTTGEATLAFSLASLCWIVFAAPFFHFAPEEEEGAGKSSGGGGAGKKRGSDGNGEALPGGRQGGFRSGSGSYGATAAAATQQQGKIDDDRGDHDDDAAGGGGGAGVGAGGGAVGLWRGCLSAYRQHYDLVMYLLASFFLNEASSIIYR
jgi:hypothetical protein